MTAAARMAPPDNAADAVELASLAREYREYAPAPVLRPYVECIWATGLQPSAPVPVRRILPDGCVDIVLEFDSALGNAYVVGTMTRALVMTPHASMRFVGIRFRPGAARAIFGTPATELTDLRPPLADLWRDADTALESVHDAPGVVSRVRAVEHMLLGRLRSIPSLAPDVQAAVRMILRASGNLEIAPLGPALGVTRQHLARAFARDVGVSPKVFARIARVRAVVARARDIANLDWGALALDLGFYDQSHLVHDVKELTGLTPGQWTSAR